MSTREIPRATHLNLIDAATVQAKCFDTVEADGDTYTSHRNVRGEWTVWARGGSVKAQRIRYPRRYR